MFRFAAPTVLWGLLLVPALGLLYLHAGRRRAVALERFGEHRLVRALMESVNVGARRWKSGITLAAVAVLMVALARPQFGSRTETVQRQGQDVVVALDLSHSMYAQDLLPHRLERAKIEVGRIIQRLAGDRIALVGFAGDAFIQTPLTTDYGAAMMFLSAMDPSSMSMQGTDLARALVVSLEALEETPSEHRIVIVVTDGEDHEGGLGEAIQATTEAGARVYAIGAGSPGGAPLPVVQDGRPQGRFRVDEEGAVITTRLGETVLQDLALQTGGAYHRIGSSGGLDRLLEAIDDGGRDLESRQVTQFEEQYQMFLAAALLLLVIESMIPGRRRATPQQTGRHQ